MKIGSLLAGLLPAVVLVACGGDAKNTNPKSDAPTKQSSPATDKQEVAADDAGKGSAGDSAPKQADTAQEPKPKKKKRIRRPRINVSLVKTLFGNDPAAPKAKAKSTPELVALGNALYHSEHLSVKGNLSCASCHDLSNYGVDNKPTSPGSTGENGDRNTPTTYNAFRHFRQFWDGRAESVEEQAIMPVTNPIEHGLADANAVVAKIKEKDDLVGMFQKAFPGQGEPVTADNFGAAIGAFERTLVTKSKFDAYLDGNNKAMSNEELLGLKTFMDVGCTQCHMTRLLGGHTYQKLGVLKPYTGKDTGRMKVTGQESDKYMFKVPSLLNVEKTAPYYHDGSIATLEDAVKDMASNQLNKKLKPEQVEALVAFLKALTGELPKQFAKK